MEPFNISLFEDYGIDHTKTGKLKDSFSSVSAAKVKYPKFIGQCEFEGWSNSDILELHEFVAAWNDAIWSSIDYPDYSNPSRSRANITAPHGQFKINYPLMIAFGEYRGQGTSRFYGEGSTGLEIDHGSWLSNRSQRRDIMRTVSWGYDYPDNYNAYVESFKIEGFRLSGNKPDWYDTSYESSGIAIWDMGETTYIHRVYADQFNSYGFELVRGTPGNFGTISSFENNLGGLGLIGGGLSTVKIDMISGDDSPALIRARAGYGRPGGGTIIVNTMKSETGKRKPDKGQILIDAQEGAYNILINGCWGSSSYSKVDSLFVIGNRDTSGKVHNAALTVNSLKGHDYKTLMHDVVKGERWNSAGDWQPTSFRWNSDGYWWCDRGNVSKGSVNSSDRLGIAFWDNTVPDGFDSFDYAAGTPAYSYTGSDGPPVIMGCTDPNADNYNPNATVDDGTCTYTVLGCTDPNANNYDPAATQDDGSCTYDTIILGCTDPEATNYDPSATEDDGSCEYDVPSTFKLMVSDFPNRSNSSELKGSILSGDKHVFVLPENGITRVQFVHNGTTKTENVVPYDFKGTLSNGNAATWDTSSESDGQHEIVAKITVSSGVEEISSSFIINNSPSTVLGCTDPDAINYDPSATEDDGSCIFDVMGCTDPSAKNYNADATQDDGSCEYWVLGCTDQNANNFDPNAEVDDGSCTYDPTTGETSSLSIDPVEMGVVINDDDPISQSIANEYMAKWSVPATNVVHVRLGNSHNGGTSSINSARQEIADQMPSNVQWLALCWQKPSRIGSSNSITWAISNGYTSNANSLPMNPLWGYEGRRPKDDLGFRPSMLVWSVQLVRNARDAHGKNPSGTVYMLSANDQKRSSKNDALRGAHRRDASNRIAAGSLEPDALLNFHHRNETPVGGNNGPLGEGPSNNVLNKPDMMMYFNGMYKIYGMETNNIIKGCIGDYVTSNGGALPDGLGQTPITYLIDSGFVATMGTVIEPWQGGGITEGAINEQFSDIEILIPRYREGRSVIDAYWKSVRNPLRSLFLGDPMCAPWTDSIINPPVEILGCTDPAALNYNSNATVDDGSCEYLPQGDTTLASYDFDGNSTSLFLKATVGTDSTQPTEWKQGRVANGKLYVETWGGRDRYNITYPINISNVKKIVYKDITFNNMGWTYLNNVTRITPDGKVFNEGNSGEVYFNGLQTGVLYPELIIEYNSPKTITTMIGSGLSDNNATGLSVGKIEYHAE